jgi:hypothetical protein
MHHKHENRGHMLITKNVHFVKLSKMCNELHHCVSLVEMIKKHIWNVQFGVRMRELCLRENICRGYQYFRSDRYFRSKTGTSGGDRYYRWSLTGSSGRCLF